MKVLVVEPDYAPYEKEIDATLEAEQAVVGGLITVSYPYKEMVGIVSNDEALMLLKRASSVLKAIPTN